MSIQITHTHTQSSTYSTQPIYLTQFSLAAPFLRFVETASCNGINPSAGDNHQSTGGWSKRQGKAKISFNYICTSPPHAFWSFAHCRAASTVIPLMTKATFTPSIRPNLGLPRAHPPLTSAINSLQAKRYSSILSSCPNHLNTH